MGRPEFRSDRAGSALWITANPQLACAATNPERWSAVGIISNARLAVRSKASANATGNSCRLLHKILPSQINRAKQRELNRPKSAHHPEPTAIQPPTTGLLPIPQSSACHSIPIGRPSSGGSVQSVFSAPARHSASISFQHISAPRRYAKNALHSRVQMMCKGII